jgi:hypothetical protein
MEEERRRRENKEKKGHQDLLPCGYNPNCPRAIGHENEDEEGRDEKEKEDCEFLSHLPGMSLNDEMNQQNSLFEQILQLSSSSNKTEEQQTNEHQSGLAIVLLNDDVSANC